MAATTASIQSHMLNPQNLLDEFACDARPEQDADHYRIQEILNLCHALVSIAQRTIYAVIAF